MRIFYRYLFKEILSIAVATVSVLTFLLVMVNAFRDLFDLLLHHEVPLWVLAKMVLLLIPFVLTFALPWGLLLAVLLVFGRMSQDRELLALKSSGIGLAPVVAPAIWLALIFSLLSFWINASVGPACRRAFKQIGYELITSNPMAFFTPEQSIEKFSGWRLYIGRRHGTQIEDVHLWQIDAATGIATSSLRADSGQVRLDLPGQRLVLVLQNVRQEQRDPKALEDVTRIRPGARASQLPLEISLKSLFEQKQSRRLDWMSLSDIQTAVLQPEQAPVDGIFAPYLTEMQKRVALALSCFTFVLVGIPLAIQTHRRETSVGVALSLAIVLGYYFVIVLAEAFKRKADVFPELIIWAPNLIFQTLGFFLLFRANRK